MFGLSNWKDGVEITSNRTDCRSCLFVCLFGGGESNNLVLKMLNLRYLWHVHVEMFSKQSIPMSLEFKEEIWAGNESERCSNIDGI